MAISSVNNVNYAYLSQKNQMKKNAIPFRGEQQPSPDVQPTETKKKHTGVIIGTTAVALAALIFAFRKKLFKPEELDKVVNDLTKEIEDVKLDIPGVEETIEADGGKTVKESNILSNLTEKITKYDAKGNKLKETLYIPNSGKTSKVVEFDTEGHRISEEIYNKNGKTIAFSIKSEYNQETGNKLKETLYHNGKLYKVIEKDPESGKTTKTIKYKSNGKTIKSVEEPTPTKVEETQVRDR